MTQVKDKSIKWDGKSRPSTELYKKNFERIFGKKPESLHEVAMQGYNEEKEEEK
jgi:hypothetical protein|tara:strand:+ start:426 stop:587 length:162 start_codon:yes stop_codon:yes gene_type:complete